MLELTENDFESNDSTLEVFFRGHRRVLEIIDDAPTARLQFPKVKVKEGLLANRESIIYEKLYKMRFKYHATLARYQEKLEFYRNKYSHLASEFELVLTPKHIQYLIEYYPVYKYTHEKEIIERFIALDEQHPLNREQVVILFNSETLSQLVEADQQERAAFTSELAQQYQQVIYTMQRCIYLDSSLNQEMLKMMMKNPNFEHSPNPEITDADEKQHSKYRVAEAAPAA